MFIKFAVQSNCFDLGITLASLLMNSVQIFWINLVSKNYTKFGHMKTLSALTNSSSDFMACMPMAAVWLLIYNFDMKNNEMKIKLTMNMIFKYVNKFIYLQYKQCKILIFQMSCIVEKRLCEEHLKYIFKYCEYCITREKYHRLSMHWRHYHSSLGCTQMRLCSIGNSVSMFSSSNYYTSGSHLLPNRLRIPTSSPDHIQFVNPSIVFWNNAAQMCMYKCI